MSELPPLTLFNSPTRTPFPEKVVAEQLKGAVPGIPKTSIIMVETDQ